MSESQKKKDSTTSKVSIAIFLSGPSYLLMVEGISRKWRPLGIWDTGRRGKKTFLWEGIYYKECVVWSSSIYCKKHWSCFRWKINSYWRTRVYCMWSGDITFKEEILAKKLFVVLEADTIKNWILYFREMGWTQSIWLLRNKKTRC